VTGVGTGWAEAVELRPRGAQRWVGVVFLSAWLVLWAVGESAALVAGVVTVTSATDVGPQVSALPQRPAGAVLLVIFLLGWIGLWTLAGVLAGVELRGLVSARSGLCRIRAVRSDPAGGLPGDGATTPADQLSGRCDDGPRTGLTG
jgi:hypothetical protein